jgi:hypothetical protein
VDSNQAGEKEVPKTGQKPELGSLDASWWLSPWQENKAADPDAGWELQNEDSPWHESGGSSDPSIEEIFSAIEYEYEELRSRARVRELAEVFTHQREVDAILDLFPDAFKALDIKFLEPTCGSGNFVVEILRRKLKLVTKASCSSREQYEFKLLRSVSSIYGIDISPENVTEVRVRVANEILGYFQNDSNTVEPSIGFLSCLNLIISENFVLGDSLNNAREIQLIDWLPMPGGCFQRIQSCALVPDSERDLFWEEKTLDIGPIHYSSLGGTEKSKKSPIKKKVK